MGSAIFRYTYYDHKYNLGRLHLSTSSGSAYLANSLKRIIVVIPICTGVYVSLTLTYQIMHNITD